MTQQPQIPDADRKTQLRFMIGAALVLLGCTFGGGIAMALYLLGKEDAAGWAAIVAGVIVLAGAGLQIIAWLAHRHAQKATGE